MTQVLRSPSEFQAWRRKQSGTVGFVPTMGALHTGHEELIKQARKNNDLVVLSIFVNPTQFNDPKDLEKYPQTWDQDLAMAERNNVDAIFFPRYPDMYPDNYRYKVSENEYSTLLDGAHRPGHFDGVLSVVMKLFNVVRPTKAYFGEKDFQQLTLIQGMVESFFMDLEIVPVPTVREEDGLAKSSRNLRLTPEERKKAPAIFKAITNSKTAAEAAASLSAQGFIVDYVTDVGNRRFVAAKLGEVRLIDNVQI
ncbi:pantoate--beta-alanine ligase [Bdellovibrio bacteriovorus]|uniref:Pantothenate synthetase n=1 Tax=Bdellovibrio bacteriovorus (strain ATCC 15356 / DSM 50701 / NCIMB 9529 / HD100) TaxID=264462 RepID=PANC_BDEBA|nr:pantoate--beta-alanine ligase [Bdellovibrio bacteriovorus]Q6MHI2.1 RecName: Full=Pantothenate synthetase; Short=PS; AltName: Full=Pantoate--beta-alanine ligase; AltName: Full=Pantoate-activating enzyme [Bdellovibrio bacteriovorus HD100]AHZ83912.1 pantothenate synthetase [Bdellovibrio bacteriovorus]BEV69888.1 Pantothenate synthetase [Bdellovibrio bacteriovorus]CAE78350.1 pantothenate synthetase [Bdellovibrio bacteriovorus HD100]